MGFDPLVVPTLVDNLKKKVIADSKTIMNYLEQEVPTPSLYPEDCIEMVEKHVKIVDDTPHAGTYSVLQEFSISRIFKKNFHQNILISQDLFFRIVVRR